MTTCEHQDTYRTSLGTDRCNDCGDHFVGGVNVDSVETDHEGETFEDWAFRLFEYEDCHECGTGADGHTGYVIFGNWFATCDNPPPTYSIVRHFQDIDKDREIIETGLSLEDAQAHCQREDTHGEGWFDGYTAE